ncbi:MAG: hypothetical protein NTZ46_05770 [Verrucomicrobia bacterium]|nr:hypothetical protein [Verrucomicrobiota bacterium]
MNDLKAASSVCFVFALSLAHCRRTAFDSRVTDSVTGRGGIELIRPESGKIPTFLSFPKDMATGKMKLVA